MRYLLDSDSTPDKCIDPVWLLGIQDPSYEPPPPEAASPTLLRSGFRQLKAGSLFCTSASSAVIASLHCQWQRRALVIALVIQNQGTHWPPEFYVYFMSRIWITYRSHSCPIRDPSLIVLKREQARAAAAGVPMPISSALPSNLGGLAAGGGGRMMLVGVVYCERVSRRLRQLLDIYI